MHDILFAIKEFEKRNNISLVIELCSDGSGSVKEFFSVDQELETFDSPEDLLYILETVNYKKDEKGLCVSPVERI